MTNLIVCGRAEGSDRFGALEVAQLISNPTRWATVQQINKSSLINAKCCEAGRGISALQALFRVLNSVKPRKRPPSNKDSTSETFALCMAIAANLTRCSAAYEKGQRVILEILHRICINQ